MTRKFNNIVSILNPLIWKCDMSNEEINDVYYSMKYWLRTNLDDAVYEWYTPPYVVGDSHIEHNGELFLPCLCFEHEEDLKLFRARFGCVK